MTLSHCWGAAQFKTLRRSNIEELRLGIQLTDLPRTFQDAVAVARWFKIRCLWIDSLGILQDCKENWLKESTVMGDIYRPTTMNTSATGAVDSTVGWFLDRNADALRTFTTIYSDSQNEESKHTCFDEGCWYLNTSIVPLSHKAWICHERLSSHRLLHFGVYQMAWECMELASCGTFPERIPEQVNAITKRGYLNNRQNLSKEVWAKVVRYHNQCALTLPSNKCTVFAALAEEFNLIFLPRTTDLPAFGEKI